MIRKFSIQTQGQGLYPITREVSALVRDSGLKEGLCTILIRHTSASLLLQENADGSARQDLERWLNRLVPEYDPLYTHTLEGPDDMPAHIKAALTPASLGIPIVDGRLALGSWQGLWVWEHRRVGGTRHLVVHLGS